MTPDTDNSGLVEPEVVNVVAWAYRGPRGGLIAVEEKPFHAPEAEALVSLSDFEQMRRERDEAQASLDRLEADYGMPWRFWSDKASKLAVKAESAEARIRVLEEALRAVSDTSHRARDRKHYRFPISIMQKVDAALGEQP